MSLHISLVGRRNLSREIYRQVSRAIIEGRLQPGERLPSSRELAKGLAVSRMTVNVAYDRLVGEGYVLSRQGAGMFVSELAAKVAIKPAVRSPGGALRPRAVWESLALQDPFAHAADYDFRTGIPDASLFPYRAWRRCLSHATEPVGAAPGAYQDPAGLSDLRAEIARRIGSSRGVEASKEDVIVVNGTQQALDVIARVVLSPGDIIAVERPGYFLPSALFQSLGLRVAGVPVDKEGIDVSAIPRGAQAVYVTPSHQFPLAVTMSFERRIALLAWAERNNAAVIEDDYDTEFRFGGRPLDSLKSIDTKGHVIYVGSFSKTMLPLLRLGFLIPPPALRKALIHAKFVSDWHTSGVTQAALARFMAEGDFARHIRKMTGVYRERRSLIAQIVARDFGEYLQLLPSEAGLHAAALCPGFDSERLRAVALSAARRRVAIQTYSPEAKNCRGRAGMMLGYGAISNERIIRGLTLLRECFGEALEKL